MSNPNCREDLQLAREIWSAQRAGRIVAACGEEPCRSLPLDAVLTTMSRR